MRALDPRHRLGGEGLGDGDVVVVGGLELHVVGTPGHSFDSLCFWLPEDRAMLTGDTVLGRGTTVIAPDGDLGDYLRSLDRLRAAAERVGAEALLPGHGPVLPDPIGALDGYLAHRRRRLDQIRRAREQGAVTPREIVEIVYAGVDRSLWPAAEMSVRAQLSYLDGVWGPRPGGRAQRERLCRRSMSMMTTALASMRSQPRWAKSARALFTVSREAPTSWASSSWVRSWWTRTPSSIFWPKRSARSSRALATRPGTSVKTRSARTSLVRRSRWARARSRWRATSGRPVSQGRRSSWPSPASWTSVSAMAEAVRGRGRTATARRTSHRDRAR
nr:hypothetical protein GCM10020093_080670 [Planobispora longispora]